MPRPIKIKLIHGTPIPESRAFFKPQGVQMHQLEVNMLSFVEFEAIRLIDAMGESQTDAARKMGISQPTISRILNSARKKIADAIVNGKALKIEGGKFKLAFTGYCCKDCGANWKLEEQDLYAPEKCPKCESVIIFRLKKEI
ncbi:MAG: DUF134 domain-containing protein [Candidatus Hodarchaeota archaeon]